MSHSPSDKSSSSNPPKDEDIKIGQNCKVYVSNIHRDKARDQEIRQVFEKFGEIKYFAMKRKPQDIVYSFIEFKSPQGASEAVSKMDRTLFFKRTLNVQFGKGGKHQQKHYETISLIPSRNRDFHSRDKQDRQRRSQQNSIRLQIRRKSYFFINQSDRITRRSSRSPPINESRYRKQYRDEKPRQEHRDDRQFRNQRIRQYDQHEPRRKNSNDKDYRKDEKRYPEKSSPRGESKPYDEGRKYEDRRYDQKKRLNERQDDSYRRRQKSGHQQQQRREKISRYENERRKKSPDNHERKRDRYLQQSQHRRQRHQKERSPSPRKDKYSRSHKDKEEQRRHNDDRYRYPGRRERDQYERERERERERQRQRERQKNQQKRRSRSRQKSSHKHKSHRREYDEVRKEELRHEKQYTRGHRSPRSSRSTRKDEDRKRRNSRSPDRKRRHSRSYSPVRIPEERRYPEKYIAINLPYRNDNYKRYQNPYVRKTRPDERERQISRGKMPETSIGFIKNSTVSRASRSRSPDKPRQINLESDKNLRFSSEKQQSPSRPNGKNLVQASIDNQTDY